MKLFVRNIPYNFTDDDLRAVFEKVGKVVTANVVTDRYTGKARGFGFVEMSSPAEGKAAIEQLNGHKVDGRALVVDKARDNREGGGREGGNREGNREGGRGGDNRRDSRETGSYRH